MSRIKSVLCIKKNGHTVLSSFIGLLLSERFVQRKVVLCWSHDFIEDIIRRRYMANVDIICNIHSDLTELFLETWIEGKQVLLQENTVIEDLQRFVCHQPLLYSETKYNTRRISELWIHLLQLGKHFLSFYACHYHN